MMPNIKGGLNAVKRMFSPEEATALRSRGLGVPGVDFADPLAPATMRMSEALGNAGAEGKTLNFTEADRSRVFGPNRGGVGFSGLQHYSEPHKQANTVWGFGKKSVAEKKIRQNDPENSLFTTFVGSPQQHKSNSVVIGDAIKEFQKSVKKGVVPREQIMLMNKRLNEITDDKTGAKVFENGFDLTDPSALSVANTFSRRAAVGDVMLGLGVKGPMARLEFKKEFPNTKFTDGSNIENILKRETDPDLVDAGTYDVGNRLFVLDNKIIERPDLNEAFPSQVTGYDLGMKFGLVPPDKAMRDFYKAREGRLDKNKKPSPVSYYDLSRAEPSQLVDEDYLNSLQKAGYKKGGSVKSDGDFNSKVGKLIEKHHFDKKVHGLIENHMAGGGLLKSAAKGVKRLFNDDVLPAAEREANLTKFLDTSHEKRRLYHATPADFKQFQGKGFDPKVSGNATWLTPNKEKQPAAHNTSSRTQVYREGVNVMPVHVKAERPLVLDNENMEDFARAVYANDSPNFPFLIAPDSLKKLKEDGYDSIFHPRSGEVIMLEPNKIKSAIGNRGTYDINEADITKATGGAVTIHPRVHEILNAPPLRMKTGGTVQRFDGGGMAMGEDSYVTKPERLTDIKKNAAEIYEDVKRELSRLKSPEARKQLAKIAAAQLAGGLPDLASFVTPLVNSDAMLSAFPMQRLAKIGVTGTPSLGRRESVLSDETVPYSLADYTNDKKGRPIGGSEHIIRRAQDAGLMYGKDLVDEKGEAMIDPETGEPLRSGRFHPLMEIGASVLGGVGASKLSKAAAKGSKGKVKLTPIQANAKGGLSMASKVNFHPHRLTRSKL